MSGRVVRAWRLAVAAGVLCGGTLAVESPLAVQGVTSAFRDGVTLGQRQDQAYPFAGYALYHTADTLRLDAADGDVDAVVLATPWERTRYQAYLATIGGETVTPAQARERARQPDGTVSVLIFAHGTRPDDQAFLAGFRDVTLKVSGAAVRPVEMRRSGTSMSQYPDTPGEIGERFTGTVTYVFRLTAAQLRSRGTLTFTDPTGKRFVVPVALTRYR